jgi:predicted RNase H-like HicB family nuclease
VDSEEPGGEPSAVGPSYKARKSYRCRSRIGRDASQNPEAYTEAGGYVVSKYLIIYEKWGTGYGGYAPGLPGCVATGRTLDQTKRRMTKAIEMNLAAMREDGDEIPKPSRFDLVEVG